MIKANKRLTINALSAVIQVIFTALLYFFLYKYLLLHLGIKLLGVWSLILSFSSIANLANLGLTSGLVKFVAEYIAESRHDKIGSLVFTALLSLAALFTLVSITIILGASPLLNLVIEKKFYEIAMSILPWSLASLCLNACSGAFTSALEGYQKNYLRNFLYIVSGILFFTCTILLTPVYHLQGVAMAQFLQSLFVLILSAILMIRVHDSNKIKTWRWSNAAFKELFSYGFKFQSVSLFQLLYEPTTKLLLSKFGGLSILGHYEMASRLVNQFRALLVNANQVVIPIVAEKAKTQGSEMLKKFYIDQTRIMGFLTFPLGCCIIAFTPIISQIWIGSIETGFIFSMYVLTISSMLNIMCGPAYFSCMGEGKLNLLVFTHGTMAIMNLIMGYVLGLLFDGYGIILGWGGALATGSILLNLLYNRKTGNNFSNIYSKNERLLLLVSLIVILLDILIYSASPLAWTFTLKTVLSILSLFLFLPVILKNNNFRKFSRSLPF